MADKYINFLHLNHSFITYILYNLILILPLTSECGLSKRKLRKWQMNIEGIFLKYSVL